MLKLKFCLSTALILFALIEASAQAEGNFQTKKITVSAKQIKLGDALLQIAEKAEFNLSFNPAILAVDSLLTLDYRQKTPAYIFPRILPFGIVVRELGNSIILQKKTSKSAIREEKIIIEGNIFSAQNNDPLENALVFEISGLASDLSTRNGYFKLEVEDRQYSDIRISIAKEGFQDSLLTLPLKSQKREIRLQPLSPLEIEKTPQAIPRKGYDDFTFSRVLVPKKVQLRTELAPITMYRDFQFSFFPGLSSNLKMSGNVENRYSINLIGGYNYGAHVLEVGSAFNIDRKFAKGWQLAGGFNFVGGTVQGVQLSGGANIVGEKMEGVQASGGINFIYGDLIGFQFAGGVNVSLGSTEGVQVSGGYNQTKNLKGVQVSGGLNTVIDTSEGLQVAPVNYATVLKGKQIGIVNIADSASGLPIGLISFVRKGGYHQLAFAADEISYGNIDLKMGVSQLYNIYSAGFGYHQNGFLWNYGLGMGTEKRTAKDRPLNYELKFHWLFKEVKNSFDHYGLIKWQFLLQNKAKHKLRLSFGPSINLMGFQHKLTESNDYESIPPYTYLDEKVGDLKLQSWIGFSISVGFRDFF